MRPPTPPPPPRASRELPAIGVNEEEKSHVWFEQGSAQYAGTDATLKSTILSPKDDDEGKSSQWGDSKQRTRRLHPEPDGQSTDSL